MSDELEQLLDPGAVRDSVLPRARAILDGKRQALSEVQQVANEMLVAPTAAVEEWEKKVSALLTLAGPEDSSPAAPSPEASPVVSGEAAAPEAEDREQQAGSMQALVIEVLGREPRKLRSRDVRDVLLMEDHDVTAESVSNALYYAASQGKILKLAERGWYAPLGYPSASEPANGRLTISDPDSV